MKKTLSILFMMMAVLTMMAHSVVPHHEHGDKICFEKIECNDSENESTKEHHRCCLDDQDIIRSVNEQEKEHFCDHGNTCDLHFPPIILFIGSYFDLPIDDFSVKLNYRPYLNLYTSADIKSANSLRGPPQV